MPNISQIERKARRLVDADSTSYVAADLLDEENDAYEEIVGDIIGCDGLWQFDDTNYTTFPIGTTTLVASQNDYAFDSSMLEVEQVAVKDNIGNYQVLDPIDISQMDSDPTEFFKTDGMPRYYDKQGASILLYPAPAAGEVTLSAGLKVTFQRTASIFTSAEVTTGTKQPGFASPFHYLISYKAALPYAMSYKKDRVPALISEIDRRHKKLIEHYSRREKDRRKKMTMSSINYQ